MRPPPASASLSNRTVEMERRLDFDRNGIDDAKVLLQDGHAYKLEWLRSDGKQGASPRLAASPRGVEEPLQGLHELLLAHVDDLHHPAVEHGRAR